MRSVWWVTLVCACSVDIDYEKVNVSLEPFAPALPAGGEGVRTAYGSLIVGEQSLSTDGGATWTPLPIDLSLYRQALALSETEVLFGMSGGGIGRWNVAGTSEAVGFPFVINGYGATRNGTVLAWNNGGSQMIGRQARGETATLVALPTGSGAGNFVVTQVAANPTVVVLLTTHGVYRSTDDGASWSFVVLPQVSNGQGRNVLALDDGRFIAFNNLGIGHVLDQTGMPTGATTPAITGAVTACLGAVLTGTQYSTDLGQTWTPLFPPSTGITLGSFACSGTALLANLGVNGTNRVARYTAFDATAQILAITTGGTITGMVLTSDGTLLSNQLGWKPGDPGWSLRVMPPGTIYALADNSLLVASPQGIHRSRDNGVTFETVVTTMPPPVFTRAFVDAAGTLWASNRVESSVQLYKSSDEGASWTSVLANPGDITRELIAITDDDTFVARSGLTGLHVSRDRGTTWTDLPFPGGYQLVQVTHAGAAVTLGPADLPDTSTVWHLWRDYGLGNAYEQVTATTDGVATNATYLRDAQLDPDDRAIVLSPTGILRTSKPLR